MFRGQLLGVAIRRVNGKFSAFYKPSRAKFNLFSRAFSNSSAEDENEETDVLIVGGGPSGLSAAIKLKQLAAQKNRPIRVVLLEKGSEIGSHILSGAVLEPTALNELLPGWNEKPTSSNLPKFPVAQSVVQDEMILLSEKLSFALPKPPQMHNRGNFIISLSDFTKWLAEIAENLGVEIYPGTAASKVLYSSKGDGVVGIETNAVGIDKKGTKTSSYQPGIKFLSKITLFAEGCRGSLTKHLEEKFLLRENSFQTFGLGLKEIWDIKPENFKKGLVLHSVGWPLSHDTYGGSFMYHSGIENRIYIGMVVGLDYSNPYLSPYNEFQRWKHHPKISSFLEGGKCISYGARALNEGGIQSIPKLSFPGGALIGCCAGFLNVPKIKGTHTAMKSGILAAEAIMEASLNSAKMGALYEQNIKESWLWKELYAVRNVRPSFKYGLVAGLLYSGIETIIFRGKSPWTLKHHSPDHLTLKEAKDSVQITYPKPDGKISFPLLDNLARSGTNHDENQPCHLILSDPKIPVHVNLEKYAGPESRYCPAVLVPPQSGFKSMPQTVCIVKLATSRTHFKISHGMHPWAGEAQITRGHGL
ncbi:hypothetical protein MDAP_001574 [Mitosporidium daphniae]